LTGEVSAARQREEGWSSGSFAGCSDLVRYSRYLWYLAFDLLFRLVDHLSSNDIA
jgi:hypothetical protein